MSVRLLVAEPNAAMTEVYQITLSAAGFQVDTASGGLECLTKLRHAAPDVLVLDLDLPWGGGEGVLTMMREDDDIPKIPVVVTNHARREEGRTEGLAAPVVQYLEKPFSLTALLTSIHNAVRQRQEAVIPQFCSISN